MTELLTAAQMRAIETAAIESGEVTGLELMERAGRGVVEAIFEEWPDLATKERRWFEFWRCRPRAVVFCGPGNNGGDGFVIARHLDAASIDVEIVLLCDPERFTGDARINWEIVDRSAIAKKQISIRETAELTQSLRRATVIVDAMLGTGATGAPRGLYADAIRIANECSAVRVAIDLPTGLDCDTGMAEDPWFRADHTCTFVAPKIGFGRRDGPALVGQIHVFSIGVPAALLKRFVR